MSTHQNQLEKMYADLCKIKAELDSAVVFDKDLKTEMGNVSDAITDCQHEFRRYGIGPSLIDPVDLASKEFQDDRPFGDA